MPVHKIPAASIHEDLIDLERQGEVIVTVTPSEHYFIVVTRYPDGRAPWEIRLAEKQAELQQKKVDELTREGIRSALATIDHLLSRPDTSDDLRGVLHGRHAKLSERLAGLTHAARVGALEQRARWDGDPLLHSFLSDDIVREDGAA